MERSDIRDRPIDTARPAPGFASLNPGYNCPLSSVVRPTLSDMPQVTLRPTIPSDLPHVIGEPLPWRIRAITALVDDRIIGMGGIAFPPHGPAIAFAQLLPPPRSDAAACENQDAAGEIPEANGIPE